MAAGVTYRWHGPVPRVAEEDLPAFRALLEGYHEGGICARLNVPHLHGYVPRTDAQLAAIPVGDELDALIRLFLDGAWVEESALAPETLALLSRAGLVARDAERKGAVFAAAAIVPTAGVRIICDRGGAPDGSRCPLPPDVVYPPVFENTRHYLASLPETPCDAMLDLGTGNGIAALAGARHARHVWATDITTRSVAYAELNRRLAGFENMTVLEGDLYHPVEGLTFDRVTMYPPYVPSRSSKFVFRDGGEDGSAIMRRLVEGLPQFLRPGGRLYATMMAFDRVGQSFEQRLRSWLGESQAEFDIAVAARDCRPTHEFMAGYLAEGPVDEEDVRFWTEMWAATKTEAVLYASIVVARHTAAREPISVRVLTGQGYTARLLDELLDWEVLAMASDAARRLLSCRPQASAHCVLETASRIHEGRFAIEAMALESRGPFRSRLACDWWMAQAIGRCDGTKSWGELYDWVRGEGMLPEGVGAEEFARLLPVLLRHGLVVAGAI